MERQLLSILCLVSLSTTSPAADPQCLPTNAPLDEKLNRMADFFDLDDDSLISSSEITHDLNPVDSNKDGFVTEDEALTLYKCAFGETEYYSRFIFNQVSQGAANNLWPASWQDASMYQLFESLKCIDVDMDVDKKLAINFKHNDHDNNHLVTSDDIAYDLNNNYDTNHDGKVTEFEWVVRWMCSYGDSGDFSRFVWDQITKGADSIQASQFTGPPFDTGIPMDTFITMNRNRYVAWAAQNSGVIG